MIYYIIMFSPTTPYKSPTYTIFILYINTLLAINVYVCLYKWICIFIHRHIMKRFLTLSLKYINILKYI